MADITKCTGLWCPLSQSCYRYTAKETPHWQSYFVNVPYDGKKKKCSEFWMNKSVVVKKKRGRKKVLT
jgi:hypothetical protein